MGYAAHTSVSCDRSRNEIETTLRRYGAESFTYGWEHGRSVIVFTYNSKTIKFVLPLPQIQDFAMTATGKRKSDTIQQRDWEQACRTRWRALNLVIKAKLEAVDSGICVFEEEFLSHIVMGNGRTVGEQVLPQIEAGVVSGTVPRQLLLTVSQ